MEDSPCRFHEVSAAHWKSNHDALCERVRLIRQQWRSRYCEDVVRLLTDLNELTEAVSRLRECQRAYLNARGDDELGKLVAEASLVVDDVMARIKITESIDNGTYPHEFGPLLRHALVNYVDTPGKTAETHEVVRRNAQLPAPETVRERDEPARAGDGELRETVDGRSGRDGGAGDAAAGDDRGGGIEHRPGA